MARSINPFQVINTNDQAVNRMMDKLDNTLQGITDKEIIDGVLLKDVVVATGGTRSIEHGLQRAVTGYIIVKRNANAIIWDSESSNDRKTLFLDLHSSANVTVDLWVF